MTHFQMTHVETGQVRHHVIGTARYGGLISMVAFTSPVDQKLDEAQAYLEELAKHADARVQTAARYLRE